MKKFLSVLCAVLFLGACSEHIDKKKPAVPVKTVSNAVASPMALKNKGETTSAPFQVQDVFLKHAAVVAASHKPTATRPFQDHFQEWSYNHDDATFTLFWYRDIAACQINVTDFKNSPLQTEQLLESLGLGGKYQGDQHIRYYRTAALPHGYFRVLVGGSQFTNTRLVINYVDDEEGAVAKPSSIPY